MRKIIAVELISRISTEDSKGEEVEIFLNWKYKI